MESLYRRLVIFMNGTRLGKRVAYTMPLNNAEDFKIARERITRLREENYDFYTHVISIKDDTIASLRDKSYFFRHKVKYFVNFDEFLYFAKEVKFIV